MRRRLWMAGAAVALITLAGCSPAPRDTPSSSAPGSASPAGASPAAPVPGGVYTDQELVDLATAVVRSRGLQGLVSDTRTLRDMARNSPGPSSTSTTTPGQCSAFRLVEEMESAERRTGLGVNFAEGRLPLAAQPSQATTIVFMIRSAPHDKLAGAGFTGTDALAAQCAHFERSYTTSMPDAGAAPPPTTYDANLVPAPPVGQQAYATTQIAKGLGPMDMGTAGLQVLAGTVSIDMALTLWPVTAETTARAVESMAGFARDLIDEAVKNPPGAPQPNPAGARSPEELGQLLQGVTGGAGTELYVTPTDARVIPGTPGVTPLPPQAGCAYDDAAYYGTLAGQAAMAQGIASTADKVLSLEVTIISMGTSLAQPYPFDIRTSAVKDCPSIQANVLGQGRPDWSPVEPLTMQLDAESRYGFKYQTSDGSGRSYVRLGARRGTLSVEVATVNFRPLADSDVQAAVDSATTVIRQVFAKAGL